MVAKKHQSIQAIFLIFILFVNLFNVQVAFADGETPTEPPVATEPAVESTPEPVEFTSSPESEDGSLAAEPVADESSAIAGILSDVPEDTNIVVLDESGAALTLGSQETADAVVNSDPVWCPAGVHPPTPGANGCSPSYPNITDLLTAMRTAPASFNADGTIYLEVLASPGFTTPLILDNSAGSLDAAFSTLSLNDLTIRGGWNTSTNTVSGAQALFGVSGSNQGYIQIGSLANPWVGNIRLEDIEVRDASVTSSIAIYTSSGNIVFDDVDVAQQTGDKYLAILHSQTGNITVENGSNFDGNDAGTGVNESKGFYAQTGTGSITITSTSSSYTFRDNEGIDPDAHNGATLIAPTVTLNNVISRANDGNGIAIQGASVVTLNNVTSSVNQVGGSGNGLSGVLVLGNGSTVVTVNGGTYAKNGRYGIEIYDGNIVILSPPTCPTGDTANGLGCYLVVPPTVVPTPTEPTPTEPTPIEPTPNETTPVPPTGEPIQATSTPPAPAISTGGSSETGTSNTSSSSSNDIIPITGGQLMDLDCNSVFLVFGVRVAFLNLCDQQTTINAVEAGDLPGDLPEGTSLLLGLDIDVLRDGQALENLPAESGIQMDFPVGAGAEYAVLFWDEAQGEWIEVTSKLNVNDLAGALRNESGDGLYQLSDEVADSFLEVLTTNQPGIFVLVTK